MVQSRLSKVRKASAKKKPEQERQRHARTRCGKCGRTNHDTDHCTFCITARRKQPRRGNRRRQSRRRTGTEGLHNESNAQSGRLVSSKQNHVADPQAEPDLLEAVKDDCENTTKAAGPSLSPTGIQRDGTSTSKQTDPTRVSRAT